MIATDLGRHMEADDFTFMIERAKRRAASHPKATTSGNSAPKLPGFKTIPQGAATTVWAAVAPELEDQGGAYCSDCAVAKPEAWALDVDNAQRLWDLSESMVGAPFGG